MESGECLKIESELWSSYMLLCHVLPQMAAKGLDEDLHNLSIANKLICKNVNSLIKWDITDLPLTSSRDSAKFMIPTHFPTYVTTNGRMEIKVRETMDEKLVFVEIYPLDGENIWLSYSPGYVKYDTITPHASYHQYTYMLPTDRGWVCALDSVELEYSSSSSIGDEDKPYNVSLVSRYFTIPGMLETTTSGHGNRIRVTFSIEPVTIAPLECHQYPLAIHVVSVNPPDKVLIRVKRGEKFYVSTGNRTMKGFRQSRNLHYIVECQDGMSRLFSFPYFYPICATSSLPRDPKKSFTTEEINEFLKEHEIVIATESLDV